MATIAQLAALDCVANSYPFALSQEQTNLLAWADCLLRADKPSLKRVEQCNAALRAAFGITL